MIDVETRAPRPLKKKALPKLTRATFRTSREMDFFSEKELITQTGHTSSEWPLVIVKELVDNALDACEESEISPVIDISADACGISVQDNGPGLPESTLKAAMDFTIRASNREAYVAPDRGAQGNALKTILPMPVVLDAVGGKLIVEAHGKRHIITCGADPISQRAVIHDDVSDAKCKKLHNQDNQKKQALSGTFIRVEWRPRETATVVGGPNGFQNINKPAWPFVGLRAELHKDDFRRLVEGFAIFNQHALIRLDWFGEQIVWMATDPAWRKWKPCQPTSAHWYEQRHIERLIGAYVTLDREGDTDRLVSDFVAEFDGLSGSQKRSRVLHDADLHRVRLSELVLGDRFDRERILRLLRAMQQHTRPVRPKRLGPIGEEHLRARLLDMGVKPESFRYSRKLSSKCKKLDPGTDAKALSTVPWVLESAFGWLGEAANDNRRIYSGANWSAAIKNPYRSFGNTGEGLEAALSDMKAGAHEPIVFVLHLAHPRVEYADRGKSALVIEGAA